MYQERCKLIGRLLAGCLVFGWLGVALAQEEQESDDAEADEELVSEADEELVSESSGPIEEITVTAQRQEQALQDVPVAISAFTEAILEDRQITHASDLQLNDTSLTFTGTNFGGASATIRGVGRLVIGAAGSAGVSTHINEVHMPFQIAQHEFYDTERVEILRGPQGTLYGRNATGGSINVVTGKPNFSGNSANFDLELGNFAHRRLTGMVNVALAENAAVRLSGYKLDRAGYTENLAYGQVGSISNELLPNINEDIDGRDIAALRFSFAWDSFDNKLAYWFMYENFHEDDDRSRRTSQICVRSPLPHVGCDPDKWGFESPNIGSYTAGILAMGLDLFELGESGADPDLYDHPRPEIESFRQVHSDFEPKYQLDEIFIMSGLSYELDSFEIAFHIGSIDRLFLSREDYISEVGALLGGRTSDISYPVSLPAGNAGDQWTTGLCNIYSGTAGVHGGCIHGSYRQSFLYDQSATEYAFSTWEVKLQTLLDGKWNFHAGYSRSQSRSASDYYVFSNTLDAVSVLGVPKFGLPGLYPGFFLNSNSPWEGSEETNSGLFGQMYFDLTDQLRFTVGLRYNDDFRARDDSSVLYNALNQTHVVIGNVVPTLRSLFGLPDFVSVTTVLNTAVAAGLFDSYWSNVIGGRYWSRTLNLLLGPLGTAPELDLLNYYAPRVDDTLDFIQGCMPSCSRWVFPEDYVPTMDELIAAALTTGAYSAERVWLASIVPIVPDFGEVRDLTKSPDSAEFQFTSSRVGFDYALGSNSMFYGFFSRGYKPGGLNTAIPADFQDSSSFTFEQEIVDAIEFGTKNTLLDGHLRFNAAGFMYDYQGLQTVRLKNNSAINENMDVSVNGLELDGVWSLFPDGSLFIDFAYTMLNTSIEDTMSLDPLNRTAGDSDYIVLKNIDPGASTGVAFIVRESHLTAQLLQVALANANRGAILPVFYPANDQGLAIPIYWSRSFLERLGITTSEGNLTDISGNKVPNAPNHSLKLGFAYTMPLALLWEGTMTLRWDFYWQGEHYSREFNTPGDYVDPWGQHNFSLNFTDGGGRYQGRFWMRNVLDDENVTGAYLTTDTSGFYRNAFTTEPRIFGVSIRMIMGE